MTGNDKRPSPKAFSILASGLAHELRNPLNSAKLQLSVLLRSAEGRALSEIATAQITAARAELERMSDLVDDYLSLSEPRVVQPASEHLSVIVDEAIHRMRARTGLTNTIHSHVEGTLPRVMADAARITQVFVHLIKNSLEALDATTDPRVLITAELSGDMVQVRVTDNGPGMAEAIVDIALQPFTTTKLAGTGLGLTLVDRLVGAHGGKLWFDSSAEGTSMYFTLPIASP